MERIPLPPITGETRQGGLYVVWFSDKHYYGGRAKQFRARWRRHLTRLEQGKHPNPYMQAVFNKHLRFDPVIVATVGREEQVQAEQEWLDAHFGKEGCLNLSRSPVNNTHVSQEARAKISKANRGRKQSPLAIRRSAESRRGLRQSEEHRWKNSLSHMGLRPSDETRAKMSASSFRKGKPITEKLKAAIVEANQKRVGEKRSQAVRDRISEVVRGRVWICSPTQRKRVYPDELDIYLEDGWVKGRKFPD